MSIRMKKMALAGCAAAALFVAAGCTPTTNVRGNMIQDYQLAEVNVGADTRSDVLRKLGSPTTTAPFDENVWYYMGQKMEKRGILDPEVVEERVVMVVFDANGAVETVEDVDNERLNLPYVRRETPTSGNEITFMQQFLGNLGRFNKEEK